jgi:N-acetylglucosamine-6-phosphate deacetylase
MRPFHHREPGTVGAIFDYDAIVAQLIGDGQHVHPAAMRTLIRRKGTQRVCLISDAVITAGLPEGEYNWDGRIVVRKGETCKFPNGGFAGAAMLLDHALRVAVERVGLSLGEALCMASEVPARVLGVHKGRLATGYDADVVVLQDDYTPWLTVIGGQVVYRA